MQYTENLVKSGASPDHVVDAADLAGEITPSIAQQRLSEKMTVLVKGAGYAVTDKSYQLGTTPGANQPLTDPDKIFSKSMRAEKAFKAAVRAGLSGSDTVYKGLAPEFTSRFGAFLANTPQNTMMAAWTANLQQQVNDALAPLGKSITLTSPNATGFVPYNLAAPTRLIYPVYTPMRNKLPRTQGQGVAYEEKVITGISGSQTGSSGGKVVDIAIPELVGGANMNNWPLNLPASGSQDSVNIRVPYKFSGLSENVSWLAQFAGQGFEDASALANLLLLQEYMLAEEYALLSATSTALATPGTPVLAARSPNTGETGLSGVTTNVFAEITAGNWYGETAASTGGTIAATNGQVVDVTIAPVPGALWYNIYVTTGASAGTYHLMASQVGGLNFTLQGAIPTATATPPAADTGTFSSLRMEGLIPTIAGHSQGSNQVYPAGWQGGYINQNVGDTLTVSVINNALKGVWDGSGAFRADPAELIGEGGDIMRLSNDIVKNAQQGYRLFIDQGETPGIRAGAAVSEFVNPVTRSIVRIVVHPWFPQGTVLGMTYNLPFGWSNVANAFEVNLVQDYLSISWPVIDATFRYSMFTYGAVVSNSPQYSFILQGLQQTDRSGTTGTWS